MDHSITVLGAGVIGLSSALALARAGNRVRVVTAQRPEQTTSAVAAACWYPFHLGDYDPQWATRTHAHFLNLLDHPRAGIQLPRMAEYFVDPRSDEHLQRDFWWRDLARVNFSRLDRAEIPAGYSDGVRFSAPVIHMPTYLDYLQGELAALGVPMREQRVERFEELMEESEAIVNCTGLGSMELCGDIALYPAQGQVVVVQAEGITNGLFGTQDGQPIYVIPRGPDIVLGGTFLLDQWDRTPSPAATETIRQRCELLVPELARAVFVTAKVGLRPCRRIGPRVEVERRGRHKIIHNYGHGGGGVSVSWGCAQRVVELLHSN